MEICLNALWFAVSLLLVGWWIRGLRARGAGPDWRGVVSVALLVLLLFPVISMTDDLMLASAPAETEHMLRRVEAGMEHGLLLSPVAMLASLVFALAGLLLLWRRAIARPAERRSRLGEVWVVTTGVRPPPPASSFALAC